MTVAVAINRAPCQGCAAELSSKLRAVPADVRAKARFILAPTGVYEPGREATADEVERDKAHYLERAQALGMPFERLWNRVELVQYLDPTKATRASDLRALATAGWDISALRVGARATPFHTILGEYAHRLATQLGRP